MKKILSNIKNRTLFKIASLNSVSIVIKIMTGFLTSKAIAIFIGPSGMALVGNFRNFITSAQAFTSLGFSNGIVKYVSEFKNNLLELSKAISTVFYLILGATFLVSFICFFNATYFNALIFDELHDYTVIIKLLALALPFYAANIFLLSIINGFGKFKTILHISIIGQIIGTIITLLLIWKSNLNGALIAMVLSESVVFFITFFYAFHLRSNIKWIGFKNFDIGYVKKMSSFSIMALFSATVLPLVALAIRNYIIDTISIDDAGYWEAMTRISNYYLMFVSTLLSLYILPRFAEIHTVKAFRNEVFNFYKLIIPIFAFGLLLVYLLRSFIISIVFTDEFQPVENLFVWQLLGDFVKVLSLVISYQFLAKKMFWHYMITEVISVVVLYFSSIYLIDKFGVKGATMAHLFNYVIYYLLILGIFYKPLFGKLPKDEIELT
ncbi:MAG: O-antigen translocase [Gelidibacter sp.]